MLPIIDGHLDVAWNALAYDRDQTLTLAELRAQEARLPAEARKERGTATVCLPELGRAGVGLFVATLFVRARADVEPGKRLLRSDCDFATPALAHAFAHGQLAYYRLLERQGHLRIITTAAQLDAHWSSFAHDPTPACILAMENADAMVEPEMMQDWYDRGVRMLSLAHYGPSAYAMGTGAPASEGPLTPRGRELLGHMERLGVMLDVSHLCEKSFHEALDHFQGPGPGRVLASHSNARRFADNNRQLTDEQIKALAERDGVIGVVLHNAMLRGGWKAGLRPRSEVTFDTLVDHVDHICQLTGSHDHAALGSDLDGGFGHESCPQGLDSIADLQAIPGRLADRGYSDAQVAAIMHGNWLRVFRAALP